jgi:hypothetical protein
MPLSFDSILAQEDSGLMLADEAVFPDKVLWNYRHTLASIFSKA